MYVNGKKVQQVTNTSCHQLTISATVPGSDLSGGDNVLAVRVSGTGQGSKRHGFADLQVAYVPVRSNPPPDYVALGDSYTSGEGLDPYQDGSNTNGNTCHRSKSQAYPELMAGRDSGLALEFHACPARPPATTRTAIRTRAARRSVPSDTGSAPGRRWSA